MNSQFYPFLFKPILHEKVWGGHQLVQFKQLPDNDTPMGESWEVSAVPTSTSVISNGHWQGRDLISVIADAPKEILGKKVAEEYHNQMPLLIKFIDAQRNLSIQVHPNDAMGQRLGFEHGKTEMWYVLAAKPGAFLYEGFSHDIDETEFRQRIADGTITDVLQKHEVKAGDVFYIPSGTVHAICSGLLVAEIQQSSDLTYRIFDYNRPGLDGKPRQLHVDLAAEALNFKAGTNYQSQYQYHEGQANTVVSSPYFNVRVLDIDHSMHCDIRQRDSFVILMCLEGDCHIHVHSTGEDVTLRHGYSAMIPAAIADYDIVADSSNGKSKVIDAFL